MCGEVEPGRYNKARDYPAKIEQALKIKRETMQLCTPETTSHGTTVPFKDAFEICRLEVYGVQRLLCDPARAVGNVHAAAAKTIPIFSPAPLKFPTAIAKLDPIRH